MKTTFKEYRRYTEEEYRELWKTSLFVFDANVLLNMYRYSRNTVRDYLEILKNLKRRGQLWLPYQVGKEFFENRIKVILSLEKSYDEILEILNRAKTEIDKKYHDHPFLNLTKIKDEVEKGMSGIYRDIKQHKEKHPKWLEKDDVIDTLDDLFQGNIGDDYSEEEKKKIYSDGKERYERKIPPGYEDKLKEDNKYGDLIIWYQLLDQAKKTSKSIIFITGDAKEDWWLIKDGKKIMPLPQLKKEMITKTQLNFHMYITDSFLENAKKYLDEVNENTINEVRKVREIEDENIQRRNRMRIHRSLNAYRDIDRKQLLEINNIINRSIIRIMAMMDRKEYDGEYKTALINVSIKNDKMSNKIRTIRDVDLIIMALKAYLSEVMDVLREIRVNESNLLKEHESMIRMTLIELSKLLRALN